MSVVIICIMIAFGLTKFTHLWVKYNPDISFVKDNYAFTAEDKFNFESTKYRIAFTVEGYFSKEMKNDPRYVKFFVSYSKKVNGKRVFESLPFHKCTADDYDSFLEIE